MQADKDGAREPDSEPTSSGATALKTSEATPPGSEQGGKPDLTPSTSGTSATGLARTTVPDPSHPKWDEEVQAVAHPPYSSPYSELACWGSGFVCMLCAFATSLWPIFTDVFQYSSSGAQPEETGLMSGWAIASAVDMQGCLLSGQRRPSRIPAMSSVL